MTAPKKVVVKFTRDYVVQDERAGTPEQESYKKDDRKALLPASAEHFVSRGLAVYVGAAKKA